MPALLPLGREDVRRNGIPGAEFLRNDPRVEWVNYAGFEEDPNHVLVQKYLGQDPFSGQLFAFRGRRGDLVKILSWDGQGLCLYAKRMEKGRFIWPQAKDGAVSLTAAQLSMLLEGIDWRMPIRTWRPEVAG